MTEFKPGDRVEYQNGIEEDPANGTLGTVLDADDPYARVHVAWDSRAPLPSPGTYPLTSHLRPVKPQKATPKAGDTVRVVLEDKVTNVHDEGFSLNQGGFIYPPGAYVKSVEITTPAKPSAKDLPEGACVKLAGVAGIACKLEGAWEVSGLLNPRTDDEIDAEGWTLLVEAKPE